MPEGLWVKCPSCEAVLYRTDLEKNLNVCPKCGHHSRLSARERLDQLLDAEGRFEIGSEVLPIDSLKFKDTRKYPERLSAAKEETGETDALVVMQGAIKIAAAGHRGVRVRFHGRIDGLGRRRALRARRARRLRAIAAVRLLHRQRRRAHAGGLSSLMQMAKTTAALHELSKARLPFISVLTDPTMGGVSASFAMIGDVVIAEPGR